MEENIQKCLVNYFKHLEKHDAYSQKIDESCSSILNRLISKTRNIESIKKAHTHEFEQLTDIKDRVLYEISLEINDLLKSLNKSVNDLEKSTIELANKLQAFEASVDKYDFPETSILTKGSATQPKLSKLLEFAYTAWLYYHGHLTRIRIELEQNNLKIEKDIEIMLKFFAKDNSNRDTVDNIMMLTQFCSRTELTVS